MSRKSKEPKKEEEPGPEPEVPEEPQAPEPPVEEPVQEEPQVQEPPAVEEPPAAELPPPGEPDVTPMHKEKNLSPEQLQALINNNLQGLQNLGKAMGEGFRKINDTTHTSLMEFDKKLDNVEKGLLKVVDFIKAQAGQPPVSQQPPPQQYPPQEQYPPQQPPQQQPPPQLFIPGELQVPQQPGGQDPLTKALGPLLGGAVGNALKPVNPYAAIGEAVVNQQLAILTNPQGDPIRQIGQAVVDEITNKGIKNILSPQGTTYDEAYLKAKATADAKRDAAVPPPPPE